MIAPNGLRGGGPTTTPAQEPAGSQGQATDGVGGRRLPKDGRGQLQPQPTECEAAAVFQNLLRTGTVTGRLELDADMRATGGDDGWTTVSYTHLTLPTICSV
eukprot:6747520-Prorocentrum_lima.AAC.1